MERFIFPLLALVAVSQFIGWLLFVSFKQWNWSLSKFFLFVFPSLIPFLLLLLLIFTTKMDEGGDPMGMVVKGWAVIFVLLLTVTGTALNILVSGLCALLVGKPKNSRRSGIYVVRSHGERLPPVAPERISQAKQKGE